MKFKTLGAACAFGVLALFIAGASAKAPASPAATKTSGGFVEIGGASDATDSAAKDDKSAGDKPDEDAKPALKENEQIKSGTVSVLRKIGMTEAFFKDLPDSYMIPSGAGYSRIYNALSESEKSGTPVSFKVNTKSRRILSLEVPAAGAGSSASGAATGTPVKDGAAGAGGAK